ncbi:maltose alpha-D-glucosyltransferase [Oceanicella sp. SM1341]|uniref:maltose alpha-D-glucosyltransferase n=1 Tax=Oceanicella sp. SM1341 TaxID=1548889 RepID=UPI001E31EDA6|nr:maltose alpha-D-glucosyltransferase [Oceanicella sp. SM1341]
MAERIHAADPHWYKDALIYQLHVKSFMDSNNDGIGDFPGLISKLDYIADLGVTAIWLLPFYPSPRRDDGYDISDYRDVSPDYGTMEDFRAFVAAAHERGIRVITELVINHTSDQHEWFQRARKAPPGSPERDFYVWSDTDKAYEGTRIIFLDTEKSNWTWDEEAGAYFWHRFYSHQPDLNFDNPAVMAEVLDVMHFWLDQGVDGLRLDAVPYLVEREGTSNENLPETHEVLRRIRADLDAYAPGRMLLAEANMWPEDTQAYFGEAGDECHMAFHFPLMPRMYMAVAQEDRFPITDIMRQTPDIPEACQWAIFLRNHDELTLEMVTDAERDYLWNTYANDRKARINLGIRRRLAPLMERDRRRIELMNALLLTMPGTPVLYYGDEIGMGDNIHLGDRDGVRTPMQWSPDRNGGFSRADPAVLTLPAIMDPVYGFQAVNVEAQVFDRHSLLHWLRRMLAVRRESQAFGRGTQRFLRPRNRRVLAYLREHGEDVILCVANLGRTAQAVELDLSEFGGRIPVELTGETPFPAIGRLPYLLTLPPYGFSWFRLATEAEAPDWASAAPPSEAEQYTFVLRPALEDVARGRNLEVFEREILPDYVSRRRWFAGKDALISRVELLTTAPMPDATDLLYAEVAVTTGEGAEAVTETYALPLGIAWEGGEAGPFAPNLALARVRRGRHVGLLTDGFAMPAFADAVVAGLRDGAAVPLPGGELRFHPAEALDLPEAPEAEWIAAEQSNSTLILGGRAVIKLLRRLQPGQHPEAEMIRHLRTRGFAHVPPFLGTVEKNTGGESSMLMLVEGFVPNQGDGWRWTLDAIARAAGDAEAEEELSRAESLATSLGRRLAEMHAVLAAPDAPEAFAPRRMNAETAEALAARIRTEVGEALDLIERANLGGEGGTEAGRWLIEQREALLARAGEVAGAARGRETIRVHGDLHLGQVLVTGSDVTFIDFEGEPVKTLAERRAHDLGLRDLAGLLRSFGYAAASARAAHPDMPATLADAFEERMRDACLAAYRDGAPEGAADTGLLALLVLEKAAYEVRYEASNRPQWLRIPVHGMAGAARALLGETVS